MPHAQYAHLARVLGSTTRKASPNAPDPDRIEENQGFNRIVLLPPAPHTYSRFDREFSQLGTNRAGTLLFVKSSTRSDVFLLGQGS